MNIIENIREGLRSVQANLLRSILTAVIVAIGITSLVGNFTAIDGIEYSFNESLASLGANTFDITSKTNRGANQQGITEKVYPQIRLKESLDFIKKYNVPSTISLSTELIFNAEVKRRSEKTNPNVQVYGVNPDYFPLKGLEFAQGRSFSKVEEEVGAPVAVIGSKIFDKLYKDTKDINKTEISFSGVQFRVIGVLKEKGQLAENNYDNMVYVPILKANQMAKGRGLWYELTVGISDPSQFEMAMGEATSTMRAIRHDRVGQPNSFDLEKSETLAENLASITNILRWVGFGVGFVTLLGASIALMNIMLVSVTERTREVGVRKALGATPARIRQQFVIEAIVVCLLGGIAGIILGILIGNLMSRAMGIETFMIPWGWMLMGFLVCIFVGLVSGYYPASKASRLDPIESLRFE
ncbi:MAG TPA: ABC transporter permease [Ohtaekwangia sp.]